jgi:hypothetical protein
VLVIVVVLRLHIVAVKPNSCEKHSPDRSVCLKIPGFPHRRLTELKSNAASWDAEILAYSTVWAKCCSLASTVSDPNLTPMTHDDR